MEKANLTKDDIKDFIIYGLSVNGISINSIDPERLEKVIEDYFSCCDDFKEKYVQGELDAFKKAACLLVAIHKNSLAFDKRLNASVAIDASEKMCEKPYWNAGPNFDVPYKLEEVDFKSAFKKYRYIYDGHRSMLTAALLYADSIEPISVYLNLELLYRLAIELKKQQLNSSVGNINNPSAPSIEEASPVGHVNSTDESLPKRKIFSLFRNKSRGKFH